MARDGWHILREDGGLTLARQLPARFDVSAMSDFPMCDASRLARQVRQDMWRVLRRVRGVSPVVRVEHVGDGLKVTAGGRLPRQSQAASIATRLDDLLSDPGLRARWLSWARRDRQT